MSNDVKQIGGAIIGATIGFFVGGPIGAVQGAQIGYTIGTAFTTVKLDPQIGPKVEDLGLQISTYGKFIPRTYGSDRLPCNIIWLENNQIREIENVETVEQGKGGGSEQTVISYTYKASLAAAICEGPIDAIDRIWLDGILVYSSKPQTDSVLDAQTQENLKEAGEQLYTDLRLYLGTQDQQVDDLIAADQPDSPAFRNTAYVVFEDLYLGLFGNRIPTITVETVNSLQNSKVQGISSSGGQTFVTFDGAEWITVGSPFAETEVTGRLQDVKYENGVWVATASTSPSFPCIARSLDGLNWTPVYDVPANNFWLTRPLFNWRDSLQYVGNNTWYALGQQNGSTTADNLKVLKSTDNALTWTLVGDFDLDNIPLSGTIDSIAYKGNEEWYLLTSIGDLLLLDTGGTNLSLVNATGLTSGAALFYINNEIWAWGTSSSPTYTGYISFTVSSDGGTTWTAADNQPYIAEQITQMFYKNGSYYSFSWSVVPQGQEGNNTAFISEFVSLLKHNADFSTVERTFVYSETGDRSAYLSLSNNDNTVTIAGNQTGATTVFESSTGLDGPFYRVGNTDHVSGGGFSGGVVTMRSDYVRASRKAGYFGTPAVSEKTDSIRLNSELFNSFKGTTTYLSTNGFRETIFNTIDPVTPVSERIYPTPEIISSTGNSYYLTPVPFSLYWAILHNTTQNKTALIHLPTGAGYYIENLNGLDMVNNSNQLVAPKAVYLAGKIYLYQPATWSTSSTVQDFAFKGIHVLDIAGLQPTSNGIYSIQSKYYNPEVTSAYIDPLAMGVDYTDGILYAYETNSAKTTRTLYSINTTNMTKTSIAAVPVTSSDENGHIGVNAGYLYTMEINPTNTNEIIYYVFQISGSSVEQLADIPLPKPAGTDFSVYANEDYAFIAGARNSFFTFNSPIHGTSIILRDTTGYKDSNANVESLIRTEILKSGLISPEDLVTTGLDIKEVKGFSIVDIKNIRTVLDPLNIRFNLLGRESNYGIEILDRAANAAPIDTIEVTDLQAHELGQEVPDKIIFKKPDSKAIPTRVEVEYRDINKDYESNTQYVENLEYDNVDVEKLNVSIVMSADEAAQTADTYLQQKHLAGQGIISFVTHSEFSYLSPGDKVTVNTDTESYLIEISSIDVGKPGLVKITGAIFDNDVFTSFETGATGIASTITIRAIPQTGFIGLELPPLRVNDDDYGIYFTMYPYVDNGAWKGAVAYRSSDNSAYQRLAFLNERPTVGFATNSLTGNMLTGVFDSSETLNVTINSGTPSSTTEDLLRQDEANIFAYGAEGRWEIVKAQNVTLESDGTYTFSKWIRGYLNTEHHMASHEVGDAFVGLDLIALRRMARDKNNYLIPQFIKPASVGLELDSTPYYVPVNTGLAQKPAAPTHGMAKRQANNDWKFDWVRRARLNWEWLNGSDVPQEFSSEQYVVRIVNADPYNGTIAEDGLPTAVREITVNGATTATYTEAQQIEDWGSAQEDIYALIYQVNPNWGNGQEVLVSYVTPPFTLESLDTYLWLDASDSDNVATSGSVVTAMTDKSGNGRDVTGVGSPELITADQNSLDTIRFNGSSSYLDFGSDVVPAGDFYVAVVWKRANTSSVAVMYSGSHSNRTYLQLSSSAQVGTSNTMSVNPATGQYNIVGLSIDADGDTKAYVNGALVDTVPTSGSKGLQYIFGNYGSDKYLAEVVVIEDITDSTREDIESFLSDKWNITLS